MRGENFLIHYWDQELSLFLQNQEKIKKLPSRKPVHDIRVIIKKMRSTLLLTTELTGKEHKPLFGELKKLFRACGIYRDLQVSNVLLGKYATANGIRLPFFEKELRSLLAITKTLTIEAANAFPAKDLESLTAWTRENMEGYSDEELTAGIKKIAEGKIKELEALLPGFEEKVHIIRKLLKNLYYWLAACPENPLLDKKGMKKLDELLGLLGKWQDDSVLAEKLRRFRKQWLVKDTKDHVLMRKMEGLVTTARDELLKKAKEETEQFVADYK